MSGESYAPYTPPPQPSKQPPPSPADECTDGSGLTFSPSLDIELGLSGVTNLPNAKLLQFDIGDSSLMVGNPLAPDCPDQQTGALVSADVPDLPLGILGGRSAAGDLVHVALQEATLKIGNPFAAEPADDDTPSLIDINAQNLPLIGDTSLDDDGGGTLLAGLLGSDGSGSATGLLSGLLASGDSGSGGDADCGCGNILQPVVDLVLEPVDGLFA
jgi:hypothetical protein